MTNQGVKLAVFVVSFSLALNLLGAMGVGGMYGIDRDPALGGQSVVNETAETTPEGGGGFFAEVSSVIGTILGAVKTVVTLGGVLTGVYDALRAFEAPHPIALTVQLAVDLGFALGVAALLRGLPDI